MKLLPLLLQHLQPLVQYLIQTQLGVPVRSTQFDPLDIRSAQPGVNTRWVVELCTTADMTKAIQSGLQAGTCKLVFYPHDDITRRETAAYINYIEVVNAHAVIADSADYSVCGKLKTRSFQRFMPLATLKLS
ncbi:hypothetical protein DPMN_079022 [Dreissena polymorpha]|uniref:Uncharacterized protein n=1 Tax=Dreissena polymorpha TaxID=45954 RepID=A0A9D3YSA9_DREPO|nr:hypothetical protein DPMN_079022 [Dreissena polymorpha]